MAAPWIKRRHKSPGCTLITSESKEPECLEALLLVGAPGDAVAVNTLHEALRQACNFVAFPQHQLPYH